MLARLAGREHEFWWQCPRCDIERGTYGMHCLLPTELQGAASYHTVVHALMAGGARGYAESIARGAMVCGGCGQARPLRFRAPAWAPAWSADIPWMHAACDRCGTVADCTLAWYVVSLPETRAFWRRHRRIRVLPERVVDAGQPALVTRFESVAGTARLEVLSARDSFRTLAIHGEPTPSGRR
jgi:hypothetical protein